MKSFFKDRRMVDMTVGSPLRLILTFAIPMFIGNIFQQLYNIVDTMIAGYALGDDVIAAISSNQANKYKDIMNLINNGEKVNFC